MNANTFGSVFSLTTFGESHGAGVGGVIDGCPAGIALDEALVQTELDRRKPGTGMAGTTRKESDTVHLLSGVFEGKTTGTSIGFFIANESQRSGDYGNLAQVFRPGHADFGYQHKYGLRDYRGGGRSSGRETAARVVGGAVARAVLAQQGIEILGASTAIGGIAASTIVMEEARACPYFACDAAIVPQWEELIASVRRSGDTVGGIVRVEARNVPVGLGEPVFDKLDARLAYACMGVGAVKGVSIGEGFGAALLRGSSNNDSLHPQGFASNHAGGVLGGISSGQNIIVECAVKPIPSIAQEQQTVTLHNEPTSIIVGGRHDICAIPRIVPVLEAMVALTLADFLLLQRRMG